MNSLNKKISRYLTSEILISFFSFFLVLSLIIFGNQFFLVLGKSVTDGLIASEIFPLMSLKYLRDLPMVIILSFSLSLIYSLNKLYKSSELVILPNAGIGDFGIFKMLLPLILVFTVFVLSLSVFLSPLANKKAAEIKESAKIRPDYIFFKESFFQTFEEQGVTFYSEDIDSNNNSQFFKDVFLYFPLDKKVILSNSGEKFSDENNNVYLRLFDGRIYQNIDSENKDNLAITSFGNFDVLVFNPSSVEKEYTDSVEYKELRDLIVSHDLKNITEIMYRFSFPISLILMSVLSIQFSRTNPRSKKNFAIGLGLITYIAYFYLLLNIRQIEYLDLNQIFIIFTSTHMFFLALVFIISILRNGLYIKI